MNWLLVAGEILTIIRPGQTKDFRENLGTMLLGELNFRTEARYTEMFDRGSALVQLGFPDARILKSLKRGIVQQPGGAGAPQPSLSITGARPLA